MRSKREKRRGRRPSRGSLSGGCALGSVAACATLPSSRQLLSCIRQGGDIHAVDEYGWSPLTRAVMAGVADNVLVLAEYGAEVNRLERVTLHALKAAARYRINEHLGLGQATSIPRDMPFFLTPLHLAALSGDAESIWVLLCNGADIHVRVKGPLPQLCGSPVEFCSRFLPQESELEIEEKRRCLAVFRGTEWVDLDKKVFRLFLHKVCKSSSSTIDTRMAQIRRCEDMLQALFPQQRVFLFLNNDVVLLQQMQHLLQQTEQFQLQNLRQHGGLGKALNDFVSFAKSHTRLKYQSR